MGAGRHRIMEAVGPRSCHCLCTVLLVHTAGLPVASGNMDHRCSAGGRDQTLSVR
jgi:hypothetical protein